MGDKTPRRALTDGESAILSMIQQLYGPQNTVDAVFFTDSGEAALFVKGSEGASQLVANLTNLAALRVDSAIPDEELREWWLRL
jgi:hypothetical protein